MVDIFGEAKRRGNTFTYNRAVQRVRKVILLLLKMFRVHSLDLILVLQYSEYLILPLFKCFFGCRASAGSRPYS